MKWYIIKLIYQIITATGKTQFDEQLRLIRADEDEWAKEKAHTLGRLGESNFFTQGSKALAWKFVGVSDVVAVDKIEDGVELYSETKQLKNINQYLDDVKRRSDRIMEAVYKQGTRSSLAIG